jgi:hypothetical protein
MKKLLDKRANIVTVDYISGVGCELQLTQQTSIYMYILKDSAVSKIQATDIVPCQVSNNSVNNKYSLQRQSLEYINIYSLWPISNPGSA